MFLQGSLGAPHSSFCPRCSPALGLPLGPGCTPLEDEARSLYSQKTCWELWAAALFSVHPPWKKAPISVVQLSPHPRQTPPLEPGRHHSPTFSSGNDGDLEICTCPMDVHMWEREKGISRTQKSKFLKGWGREVEEKQNRKWIREK